MFGALPAGADDAACTSCRVAVVKRALRAKGTIDCAQAVPVAVVERVRRALASCEQRHGCGSHEAAVLAAIDDGVAAIEARVCAPVPTPTSTPGACSAIGCPVLRIRCLPDDHVEVLTPVVIAQPDGLHVEVVDDPPLDANVGLQSLALPNVSWWSASSGVSAPFLRPVPEGDAEVWCIVQPFAVVPDASRRGAFTIVDPEDVFRSYALECGTAGEWQIDLGGDAAASVEAAVRQQFANLLDTDTVERAGYIPGDPEWPWLVARVVRAGSVVAWVAIDGREGWRYRTMNGAVCSDAGLP
jgi:hypothetical protein